LDSEGRTHPTADADINFSIEGPGRIIGVGNGNPSSHEPEQYFSDITTYTVGPLKELPVDNLVSRPETAAGFDDSAWKPAFEKKKPDKWKEYTDTLLVVRGKFDLPALRKGMKVRLFGKSILENQSVYINGHLIASDIIRDSPDQCFVLDPEIIREGVNEYAVTGQRFRLKRMWDEPNTDPGVVQVVYPAESWKRKAFNGLAEIIIQAGGEAGEIKLKASSEGLKEAVLILQAE